MVVNEEKRGQWMRWARGPVLCMGLALGACASEHDKPLGAAEPKDALGFGSCPRDLPGTTRGRDCAVNEVPLRWDEPDGEKIDVLVARYLSPTPHRGQLWLLDGGPGGTGGIYMLDQVLELYASLGLDVYIPQHRGTGHSTPLGCSGDDLAACGDELIATWGDGLRGFHSTEAGRDVGNLIERFRKPGEPVFVFGLSYGSWWAQRYLQAFPAQANGVILEGVLPLDEALWEGDGLADEAARSVFQACRDEPDCAAAFGDEDPEDVALRVIASTEDPEHRCMGEDGPERVELETALSLLVVSDLGHFVPGLLRRLDRCTDSDQDELVAFAEFLTDTLSTPPDPSMDNGVLGTHVLRSDLMASLTTFPLDERLAAREPLVFWSGAASTEEFDAIVEGWPVNYPAEPSELTGLATPVVLLNGGLDIQTPSPWARKLAKKIHAQLIEFPFVGHGVDISLAEPYTAGDASCSLGVLRSFIDDPGSAIDASCAAIAYTPDVAGHQAVSAKVAALLYGHVTSVLGPNSDEPSPKRARSLPVGDADGLSTTLRHRLATAARELPRWGRSR